VVVFQGGNEPVLAVDFNPNDSKRLVTCGKSHIAFWRLNEEKKIEKKMGVFEVIRLVHCMGRLSHLIG
jgi:microtubule-associated protein-like 1/2